MPNLSEMALYSDSRMYEDHQLGRRLVCSHLEEDGSKKVDYNKSVWNWKRLGECRESELLGKHMPEARSFSSVSCHRGAQTWSTGEYDLLSSKRTRGRVGSYIHS